MDDRQTAKRLLTENKYSLCVVRAENVLYSSHTSGILPLYQAFAGGMDFESCSAADKVVGLGAAMLWQALDIKALHAHIISQHALEFFSGYDIDISYDILASRIKSRTGDGVCPIEALALSSDSFDSFLSDVHTFLSEKELI